MFGILGRVVKECQAEVVTKAAVGRKKKYDKCNHELKTSARRMNVMRVLFMLSGGSKHLMEAAWAQSLTSKRKQCQYFEKSDHLFDCIRKELEHETLSQCQLNFLLEPATLYDQKTWFEAWLFYSEWRTAWRIVGFNMNQGVAVQGDMVYISFVQALTTELESVPSAVGELTRKYLAGQQTAGCRRSWISRWRDRWGFGFKTMPSRKLGFENETSRKVKIE